MPQTVDKPAFGLTQSGLVYSLKARFKQKQAFTFYKTTYQDDVGTLQSHSSIFPIRVVSHFVKTALFCCPNAYYGETDYFIY